MGLQHTLLTNRHLQDINPLIMGQEDCEPGHRFGPAVRPYVLIHFVMKGKGLFEARGQRYEVSAGQAFLIIPGEVTIYTADATDPWHYCWIGFDGALAERFKQLEPVFSLPDTVFARMFRAVEEPEMAEYRLAAELLRLYALLFGRSSDTNHHVRRVENYIRSAYMEPIRVEKIAEQLSLDRRYLSRLFKEKTGFSIQEYLISVRMEAAELLLQQGRSVKEAAYLSGYEDVSNFSKMFKKYYGKSPADLVSKDKKERKL